MLACFRACVRSRRRCNVFGSEFFSISHRQHPLQRDVNCLCYCVVVVVVVVVVVAVDVYVFQVPMEWERPHF